MLECSIADLSGNAVTAKRPVLTEGPFNMTLPRATSARCLVSLMDPSINPFRVPTLRTRVLWGRLILGTSQATEAKNADTGGLFAEVGKCQTALFSQLQWRMVLALS